MNVFFQFIELFATFTESVIVLSAASSIAQKRYEGKKRVFLILLFSVIETIIVTVLNKLEAFSFVTIGVGLIFTVLVLTILSSGNILLKITSTVLTWLGMFAVDYIIMYSFLMIVGNSLDITNGLSLFMTAGIPRLIYLVTDKILQAGIFVLLRKLYSKIKLLSNKNLAILSVISLLSFIVMNILAGLIYTDSVLILQTAVMFAIFFIVISMSVTIFAIGISAKHQNEKQTVELMRLSSRMMEKNYNDIHASHEIIRRQVHDFKNHLRAINGIADEDSKVREYVENLLETSYSYSDLCHCGNDIIDSIINCKEAEALENNIQFEYHISLTSPLNIESIDICAILANQIDNAVEACLKIEEKNQRKISINIYQKEYFVFFTVKNTAKEDPFGKNNELITSKNNSNGLHGFGIRIIRETAEKYNGTSENVYAEGQFISNVMLINND